MQQTKLEPQFTLRTSLGLATRFAQERFYRALEDYKQKSGALPMLQSDISDRTTQMVVPVIKKIELEPIPTLLRFSSDYPPMLAIEAAIHHHLDKCRSLPAVFYVDSKTFLPALIEQYERIKCTSLNGVYVYFTGHHLVRIPIATEKEMDAWARFSLNGKIPANTVISALSI